jgi:diguanylate cyclase (GGDEF)-like protein
VTSDTQPRINAIGGVLLWQSRIRIAVALIAGGAQFIFITVGVLPGQAKMVFEEVAAYIVIVAVVAFSVRRTTTEPHWAVAATVMADLLFIFGSTMVSSPPVYFGRILIFSFFILHLTESYFGREYAWGALVAVIVGYLALVASMIAHGAPMLWPEELWSVLVFAIAAVVFVLRYGSFRRRLSTIVALFERAEEGDFAREYDVMEDRRPDAITSVGRAYNRVRSQLMEMVLTDPLTECVNRRGFDQALAREVARSTRAGSELSLLALDLDFFKQVNDTHGHLAGDAVLREAGMLLSQTARGGDVVSRTGGEEFSIVLPDTPAHGAFLFASRLCDTVRAHAFIAAGTAVKCTVSVGVVSTGEDSGANLAEELKLRADEALYSAKRSGRDRVRVWTPTISTRRPAESSPELTGEFRKRTR